MSASLQANQHPQGRTLVTFVIAAAALAIGMGLGFFLRPAADGHGHAVEESTGTRTLYTCGMHPEIVSDEPGLCPKCEMKLTPMDPDRAAMILEARGESTAGLASSSPAGGPSIRIDPVTEQNMGVRYSEVRRGEITRTIRTLGTIEYNERAAGTVTTKVSGWVEKVHVNLTGATVAAGDPLFELYSPELYSAQQEYLVALRDAGSAAESGGRVAELAQARLDSATQRLRLFDISEAQVEELRAGTELRRTLTITAQISGVVTQKNVTEGEYVEAGSAAYQIAGLSTVWVMGKVFESDLPFVKTGQEAEMRLDYLPGEVFTGTVTQVYPYLDEGARQVSVRVEFENPDNLLKPGMYATILIHAEHGEGLLVPASAILRTGERNVVFVATEPGRFESRDIDVGVRAADGKVQVLGGLDEGERVVVSGQFLLDSEARLREATLKMVSAAQPSASEPTPATPEPVAGEESTRTGPGLYTCPMASHKHIVSDEPGRCPECNMVLVPTSEVAHGAESERIWHDQHPAAH